jgi:hypothetical protein
MRSIIIEGIDRLGKDTLIKGLQHQLGAFQVIHYQKPELLDTYVDAAKRNCNTASIDDIKVAALKAHQIESFRNMLYLLSSDAKLILNRAHLGEMVYAPRYRKYDGSYVFELERFFRNDLGSDVLNETLLVLLYASDTSFIKDDGLSFDFNAKQEEQADFIRAFKRSGIRHKVMIDVSVNGGYVPANEIVTAVVAAYSRRDINFDIDISWRYETDQLVQMIK